MQILYPKAVTTRMPKKGQNAANATCPACIFFQVKLDVQIKQGSIEKAVGAAVTRQDIQKKTIGIKKIIAKR
ncbi:MAG: hypothetical protein IPJ54_10045 [Saprospiraceae bacterium]|nr:hypothetical protein [Saprospiraceae bacterium]